LAIDVDRARYRHCRGDRSERIKAGCAGGGWADIAPVVCLTAINLVDQAGHSLAVKHG